MPRTRRQCPGGLIYHVLNRSVARINLFRRDKDYHAFEQTLAEARQRTPVDLLGYCVMPNHWHLVVRPAGDKDLSAFMQWLTLTHAQRWRTARQTVGYGPLYQGRFKAFVIQEDRHLLTVLRYVERNPLRADLVTRAEHWRWSSLYRRVAGAPADLELLADWPIERPAKWVEWVNHPQTAAEEEAVRQSIGRSRPFGAEPWQRRMAAALGLTSCFRPPGRPKSQE
jgi:putative transposase